jgi:hypothetical protein
MATTTNYSWTTPDDTALVKDGAAAIRSLGTAIDSTVFTNAGNAINKTIVDAKGDIIAATAADTVARLGVGTNGQYLAANSSTATGLEWQSVSAGGMTLISTTTLTGASVSLTSIPATYKNLQIVIRNYLPATDAQSIRMTVNSTSSIYRTPNTLPESSNQSAGSTYIINGDADNAVSTGTSVITIFDYANTATIKVSTIVSAVNNEGTPTNFNLKFNMGIIGTTSAISSIQFVNDSGNFTSGTVLLYGVS